MLLLCFFYLRNSSLKCNSKIRYFGLNIQKCGPVALYYFDSAKYECIVKCRFFKLEQCSLFEQKIQLFIWLAYFSLHLFWGSIFGWLYYFWHTLLGDMVFEQFWGCCAVCSLYTKSFVNGTGKMSWMTWRIRSRRWTVLWLVFSQIFWLFWALCSSIFSAQRFFIFCGMVFWKERQIWFID